MRKRDTIQFDLKAFRISKGLTQRQFASKLNVSHSLIGMIEAGRAPVTYTVLMNVIGVYGQDAVNLVTIIKGE